MSEITNESTRPGEEIPTPLDLKILYVEDDSSIRENLTRFLERRFNTVVTAENGKLGLDQFKSEKPDIVITDIRMPEMDGLEMSKAIREINPAVPILITTAYYEMPYIRKAIVLGIGRYRIIQKPINKEDLIDALQECVRTIQNGD